MTVMKEHRSQLQADDHIRSNRGEPAVVVDRLTKKFGDFVAVDEISYEVPQGSIFGFLGPNGAGKTTSLGVMLGLIPATSGTATIFGYDIHQNLPEVLKRTGAMVERPALYPYMSGRDNLRLWAYLAGISDNERVEQALASVDLLARADAKFGSYSTGMKQRLGIATALLRDPDLVILDEPTNGLDPAGQREIRSLIRSLAAQGRTVMLSSHLLYEVQEICTDVAIINRGKLIASGPMSDVLQARSSIEIRVDRPDDAEQVLKQIPEISSIQSVDGLLVLLVEQSLSGRINRKLVEAGIEVTELRPRQRKLEDEFISLTSNPPSAE